MGNGGRRRHPWWTQRWVLSLAIAFALTVGFTSLVVGVISDLRGWNLTTRNPFIVNVLSGIAGFGIGSVVSGVVVTGIVARNRYREREPIRTRLATRCADYSRRSATESVGLDTTNYLWDGTVEEAAVLNVLSAYWYWLLRVALRAPMTVLSRKLSMTTSIPEVGQHPEPWPADTVLWRDIMQRAGWGDDERPGERAWPNWNRVAKVFSLPGVGSSSVWLEHGAVALTRLADETTIDENLRSSIDAADIATTELVLATQRFTDVMHALNEFSEMGLLLEELDNFSAKQAATYFDRSRGINEERPTAEDELEKIVEATAGTRGYPELWLDALGFLSAIYDRAEAERRARLAMALALVALKGSVDPPSRGNISDVKSLFGNPFALAP